MDILNIFQRVWDNLLERTEGPFNLRFLIQPSVSIIFAIKAAIRDAKAGTIPYLWRLFRSNDPNKRGIIMEVWKDVGKIFIVGTLLDIAYQLMVIHKHKTEDYFYPLESLIVATLLAIVPYILLRGPVNRIVRRFINRNKSQ